MCAGNTRAFCTVATDGVFASSFFKLFFSLSDICSVCNVAYSTVYMLALVLHLRTDFFLSTLFVDAQWMCGMGGARHETGCIPIKSLNQYLQLFRCLRYYTFRETEENSQLGHELMRAVYKRSIDGVEAFRIFVTIERTRLYFHFLNGGNWHIAMLGFFFFSSLFIICK